MLSGRRWLAPEVVQTSAMDCGPAALKCLLEGFRIPVSYGRLREACQTSVDGTSIDILEGVANDLGIVAEQVLLPEDHVFLPKSHVLPALIVVRHSDGPTHFVVVWRRTAGWLQVMDPALGRRWVKEKQFRNEIFRHEMSVPAATWREWAATRDFLDPLCERLARLGTNEAIAASVIEPALNDDGWFSLGALDASVRLVEAMRNAGGLAAGTDALKLLQALWRQTCENTRDIYTIIPPDYWSVAPDPASVDLGKQHLLLRGAVLLKISEATAGDSVCVERQESLSPELAAALNEKPTDALQSLWVFFRADGLLSSLALAGALVIASSAMVVEALLIRGIFDIGAALNLGSQRLVAALGLLAFISVVLAFQIPIVAESLRFGRHLDTRLRMALLRKLPRLSDRYFQSRPVSDMADRSHSIHLTRTVPGMGVHFMQSICELILTLVGIAFIDPHSALFALAIAVFAIGIPALFQPMINERDLRIRNHSGALNGFYLDALLGLIPIRAHRAQPAVRHQHESLLVEWVRSTQRLVRVSIVSDGVQAIFCVGLAALLLFEHFLRSKGVTGADLLLVYWALKLPAIGHVLTSLAHQYPMQRNVLLRLLEPLSAPELGASSESDHGDAGAISLKKLPHESGVGFVIENGQVVAAGHTILQDINLKVRAGEHVAIVGLSGAGKSSLIGLLLGWHSLAAGRLLIDGIELTESDLANLRRQVAWLDPAVQIWNKPFLENLVYSGRESDLPQVAGAIDGANLRRVLQNLPDGLQTPLGEGGALLSGGEGQRVRLGRTFVQSDVRMALLDEPFRGLDRDQRSIHLANARAQWKDATLLCVTHDVAETLAFDRVLVIEGGVILEDGNPAHLSQSTSRYRELLDAERDVRDRLWKGKQWRRLVVQGGQVESARQSVQLLEPIPSKVVQWPYK